MQPVVWAGLAPQDSGTIAAINVKTGDWVTAGDLLLELDNAVQQSQVNVAEAALGEAEAAGDSDSEGVAHGEAESEALALGLCDTQPVTLSVGVPEALDDGDTDVERDCVPLTHAEPDCVLEGELDSQALSDTE